MKYAMNDGTMDDTAMDAGPTDSGPGERASGGPPGSGPAAPPPYVIFERDRHGSPYAVEVVEAEAWDAVLLDPPEPTRADARVVRVRGGTLPDPAELPRWLAVTGEAEQATAPATAAHGIAETPAIYTVGEPEDTLVGTHLWPWSPHFREPGAALADFLTAAATALRYPAPAPTGSDRQRDQLRRFCAGRRSPLGQVAELESDALERWLRYAFDDPERLAHAILTERIADDGAAEVAAALRFIVAARVPEGESAYAELAVDRRVVMEQASPWRFLDGEPFAGLLALVQAWMSRYRLAYDAHYRSVIAEASALLPELEAARRTVAALRRFNGVSALGPPVGEPAMHAYGAAVSAIEALSSSPHATAARTANIALGERPPQLQAASAAVESVRSALEKQRRRLASSAVRLVLDRSGVPALDRLLQAIHASDLGGIERALDDRLTAHIDALLSATASESPLTELARRYPEVTPASVPEVVEALAELLTAALADSEDGSVALSDAARTS